jgi:hypothetical protein
METRIKNGVIIISMPLQEPKLSTSQKPLIIATSRGKRRTALKVDGKSVFVIANALLEVDDANGRDSAKPKQRKARSKANRAK